MNSSLGNVDNSLVRRLNTQTVLRALRSASATTLTELAHACGLSRQTARTALAELIDRDLCELLPPLEGGSGRPAQRFSFREHAGHALGISFAPKEIVIMISDLTGSIVAKDHLALPIDTPARKRLAMAEDAARRCSAQARPIWAAVAGTSGVVDRDGRLTASSGLRGMVGLNVAELIGDWFGCAAGAHNDAALAALAERWLGDAQHADDFVAVLTGHRTGFGLMIDSRLHIGKTGSAAELGLLPQTAENDPAHVLERHPWTADEAVQAVNAGDERAQAMFIEIADGLARSAAVVTAVIDPELIVVGGILAGAGDHLLSPMRDRLTTMSRSTPGIVASNLGADAVALGAVRSALDLIEENPDLLGPPGR